MTGRKLISRESKAVDACNSWLQSKMLGRIGYIDPAQSVFVTEAMRIDVGWNADTKVGKGMVQCSTDGTGTIVTGAVIDGIQVRP